MARRHDRSHGTPIEEAPLWMLAILAALLALVTFPALVGLLAGWGAWQGQVGRAALAAVAVAALVVAGAATRPSWRRPRQPTLHDPRPFFVRFSTWLWAAVIFPNVLYGVLVLGADGAPPPYEAAILVGLLASAVHGLFALAARWQGKKAGRRPAG
jgi:hypothetical protein